MLSLFTSVTANAQTLSRWSCLANSSGGMQSWSLNARPAMYLLSARARMPCVVIAIKTSPVTLRMIVASTVSQRMSKVKAVHLAIPITKAVAQISLTWLKTVLITCSLTYDLLGKHKDADCDGCHAANVKHRDAPSVCVDCHLEDDVHQNFLGDDCAECHNPNDWLEVEFDHDTTGYALLGKHLETGCSDCHADQTHQNTPTSCFGCHAEDDSHQGRSGEQCENCHNPSSWNDASFDHNNNTNFPLEFKHATLSCTDCHSPDPFADVMQMACVSCHLEDDDHEGRRGEDCETCHTSEAWDKTTFDHNRATDFSLNGSHQSVACNDCHVEPVFESSPGTDCVSCHQDDDPHSAELGEQCDSCHNETEWLNAPLFYHELTNFPLLGEHANIDCENCHETQKFVDTSSACIDCHQDDDHHDGVFERDCESCHNPVAWDLWLFDHNVQTDYRAAWRTCRRQV